MLNGRWNKPCVLSKRKAASQLCAWGYGGLPPDVIEKYQDKWDMLGLDG